MTRRSRDSTLGAGVGRRVAHLVVEVPSSPDQVAAARHAVVAFLAEHAVPSAIVDDLELLTSELVTNAIIHPAATDRQVVGIEVEASDTVVIAVSNVGPASAIPPVDDWHPAPPLAVSGRGLGIVRRLSDAVSVEQRGDLTVVSCRRRLPDGGGAP
jgi:anti-sigma regulatory factor (Ser/Thr protein kinase)